MSKTIQQFVTALGGPTVVPLQEAPIEVTANFTAEAGKSYHVIGGAITASIDGFAAVAGDVFTFKVLTGTLTVLEITYPLGTTVTIRRAPGLTWETSAQYGGATPAAARAALGMGTPAELRTLAGAAAADLSELAQQAAIDLRAWLASVPAVPRRRIMSSPPTPTNSTSQQLVGGIQWSPVSTISLVSNAGVSTEFFAFPRCGFRSAPGAEVVSASHVTVTSAPTYSATSFGVSFIHEGRYLEIVLGGSGLGFFLKVDDEYFSLTPETIPGSNRQYFLYDFGSRSRRRIDILGGNLAFYGVWTEPTDTVTAAEIRGPRCMVFGDSFTQEAPNGYVNALADALGWDDVWGSGVGGTGYSATNSGTRLNFLQRIADITDFAPSVVLVFGSINDAGSTTNVSAFWASLRAALPRAALFAAVNQTGGVNKVNTAGIGYRAAVRAAVEGVGGTFLDLFELPRGPDNSVLQSTVLNLGYSAGQAGATGIRTFAPLLRNKTYEISNTERITVRVVTQISANNWNATFDGSLQYAHSSGGTVQQVAGSLWTGNGYVGATTGSGNSDYYVSSDAVHPSVPVGAVAIGQTLASLMRGATR